MSSLIHVYIKKSRIHISLLFLPRPMATGIWSSEMYGLAERTTQCANLQCCHCCLRHSQWMATCFVSAQGQGLKPLEIICTQWWLVHTEWFFKPTGDLRLSNGGSIAHMDGHALRWRKRKKQWFWGGQFGAEDHVCCISRLYAGVSWNPLNTPVTLKWTNGQWKRTDWLKYGGNLFPTFLIEVLLYWFLGTPKY